MSAEYVFDRHGLAHDASIDLHDYLAVRNALEPRIKERVVRCRDCKRVTIDQGDHDYREPLWCSLHRMDVCLDGFCSWGVAR